MTTWAIPEEVVEILYKSPQIYQAYKIAERDRLNKEGFLVLCIKLLYETLSRIERYQMEKVATETRASWITSRKESDALKKAGQP
jgi:hypothetical protein